MDNREDNVSNLEAYKRLERELLHIRKKNGGKESSQEESLLAQMDLVWQKLTQEEIEAMEQEGNSQKI